MADFIIKILLCICVFVNGSGAFASVLSAIEIKTEGFGGKIILNTDKNSIKRKLLSNNEIELKLNNTKSDSVKTLYTNPPLNTEISIMQKGKDTYLNISGENIADFELISAKNDSVINTVNHKKDFGLLISIFVLLAVVKFLSEKHSKHFFDSAKNFHNNLIEYSNHKNYTDTRLKKVNDSSTIRKKTSNKNINAIHGAPIKIFADNNKYSSVTTNPAINKNKYLDYSLLKKAVNS